ncbi:MAG: NADP-dependent phosphogluconate dehydrogenase [Actinobacteria bacterium]|nr:NADP-dependent phosphogluconate dehydrogenase [Actinomycetota bacterium]
MSKQKIGLVGLAVMGENLALNIESKGFPIAVFNRTTAKTEAFIAGKAKGKNIVGAKTVEEFVGSLEKPRKIILLVKAGEPVDAMINSIVGHLDKGDLLIDGGNSFFKDTARRSEDMASKGILYIGTGVSGGEEGALKGPSIMPGGPKEAYLMVEDILTKISAQVDDGPCCIHIGPGASGHYVKMVHNGIEYGDMQLICEAYDILKSVLGLKAPELSEIFSEWNKGELDSYLIEITAAVLARKDDDTGKPLVDIILDKAGQKGTGKWTSQSALDLGVPTPTINSAVVARTMSAFKDQRVAASKILSGPTANYTPDKAGLIQAVREALYASKITSYAQGMALLREANKEYGWNLNYGQIARIWKGGCIIRAKFLDLIKQAYQRNADLPNLLIDKFFSEAVTSRQDNWRMVVKLAVDSGVPVPAISGSLAYFDSYRRERLPANLIQAQRDYFGAHTYERLDKPGSFHTEWMSS